MIKLLIIKPKVDESDPLITHYIYPKGYNAEHVNHICYNFRDEEILKGGQLAEGMVIYKASEAEIKALLQEDGVTEINYDDAEVKGKQWKPEMVINGISKPAFNISEWVEKSKISTKVL